MTEEGKRLVKMAVKNEGKCDRVEMEEGELAADGGEDGGGGGEKWELFIKNARVSAQKNHERQWPRINL